MDNLDPRIAKKLLEADDLNLVNKLGSGKTLNKSERERLEKAIAETEENPNAKADLEQQLPRYAPNIAKASELLGISRMSFYNYKKIPTFPKQHKDGWPLQRIQSWIQKNRPSGLPPGRSPTPKNQRETAVNGDKEAITPTELKKLLDAKRQEIHIDNLLGRIVWDSELKEVFAHFMLAWLGPVQRMPAALASLIDPENPAWVEKILSDYANNMIKEMKRKARVPSGAVGTGTQKEKRARPSLKAIESVRKTG